MLTTILLILSTILFLWVVFLTVSFFRLQAHYNRLSHGVNTKTLRVLLEEILKRMDVAEKDIVTLISRCDTIEKDGMNHIQKIGLLRFNPFKDTGGNQSFIVSFVDANNTGVVISGLYSRSGTRWYAKRIVKGIGTEHELSEEEKTVIKEAKKL